MIFRIVCARRIRYRRHAAVALPDAGVDPGRDTTGRAPESVFDRAVVSADRAGAAAGAGTPASGSPLLPEFERPVVTGAYDQPLVTVMAVQPTYPFRASQDEREG